MRIALVAGEASGDILGAGLMRALKAQHPNVSFEGIGGPLMEAEGLHSRVPMERLSVMGLVEVLGRLRELLKIRRDLGDYWLAHPPAAFIGIDAPDFNLGLERRLRDGGIPSVHYVSPSVWAWREGRVKKIAKAVDLMLCLLPFEVPFYAKYRVDARFVGHTLADELPLEPDVEAARRSLNLDPKGRYIALLPGSRGGEVERLGPLFLDAAECCLASNHELQFLLPAANASRRLQIEQQLAGRNLPLTLVDGRSREVMLASDAVLLASGTAALEGMLLKKPMVVAYRFAALSWAIISRMVKVKYVALPNASRRLQIEQQLAGRNLPLTLVDGRSREVMLASDAVLLASGTAALEGMLLKKPMVVAYRFAALSWAIISRMVKVKYVALPNLLADEELVPELLQDAATPERLAATLLKQLDDTANRTQLLQRFTELHRQLKLQASEQSAAAVLALIAARAEVR